MGWAQLDSKRIQTMESIRKARRALDIALLKASDAVKALAEMEKALEALRFANQISAPTEKGKRNGLPVHIRRKLQRAIDHLVKLEAEVKAVPVTPAQKLLRQRALNGKEPHAH